MIKTKWKKTLLTIALTVTFFGAENPVFADNQNDPYETFNRHMFNFNDALDTWILKPVANLYNKVIPKPLTKGLSNFYNNIDMIPTVLNDVLQGNFYQASSDAWRFGVNSTVGILGFFDVAQHVGLEPNLEDFGLTLARWGWNNSNYLVLPFLGPSTVRDGLIGFPVNYYGLSIYPYLRPASLQYGLYFGGVVVRRADLLRYEALLNQVSFDKYIFMRDAYIQHRNYLIDRNNLLGDPYLANNKLLEGVAAGKKEEQTQIETKPFSSI